MKRNAKATMTITVHGSSSMMRDAIARHADEFTRAVRRAIVRELRTAAPVEFPAHAPKRWAREMGIELNVKFRRMKKGSKI